MYSSFRVLSYDSIGKISRKTPFEAGIRALFGRDVGLKEPLIGPRLNLGQIRNWDTSSWIRPNLRGLFGVIRRTVELGMSRAPSWWRMFGDSYVRAQNTPAGRFSDLINRETVARVRDGARSEEGTGGQRRQVRIGKIVGVFT